MKKALMKFLLRMAIALALWAMTDKTKAKISQSAAEKIGELYRRMKQRMKEQELPTPEPDVKTDNVRPVRRIIDRLRGRFTDGR